MIKKLENLFGKLQQDIVKKPVKERLRTRALGGDPEPVIVFVVDGAPYTLDLTDEKPPFWKKGDAKRANLRVELDWETMKGVVKGEIFGVDAMRDGRIDVQGNQRLLHGLQRYFEKPE